MALPFAKARRGLVYQDCSALWPSSFIWGIRSNIPSRQFSSVREREDKRKTVVCHISQPVRPAMVPAKT
jgi:hypothetical protein